MTNNNRVRLTACAAALTLVASFATAQQRDDAVTMPREVVAAAAVFQGYMDRATAISPAFKSAEGVYQGLKTGVGYEQGQFQEGMIGYAAIAALQDDRFVDGVERAARREGDRHALVERMLADPTQVMTVDGAYAAGHRARAALQRRADAVFQAGRSVKQSAYDVQHSAWSKARVPDAQGRLAEVKRISQSRAAFVDGEEGRLIRTLADQSRVYGDGGEAPTPMITRALALAAIAVLGEARTSDIPRLQPLLAERTSGDCLRMAKLNLYQCMAVAGPHYEDIFCLGQHALMDTGQCVARAASYAPPAPPALPPTRVAAAPPPAGAQQLAYRAPQAAAVAAALAPAPRAFRAD